MKVKSYVRGLAVLLAILMSYQGYVGTVTAQTLSAPLMKTLRYDGEATFRGVFLADGPVAKLFPEIWENPKVAPYLEERARQTSPEEIAAGNQRAIDGLKAQDPTFFVRFGTEMQSGDRIRISNAVEEASQRLTKLVEKSVDPPKYAYTTTAIAVMVVAVAVAAVAVVVFWGRKGGESNLQRDILVNLMAQRLGPATR